LVPAEKLAEVGAAIQPDADGKPRVAGLETAKLVRKFVTRAGDALLGSLRQLPHRRRVFIDALLGRHRSFSTPS